MAESLESLREAYGTGTLVVAAAFLIGGLFGIFAEISQYCTRAAVAEWAGGGARLERDDGIAYDRAYGRTLQVLSAILVALAGTSVIGAMGMVDLDLSIYLASPVRPFALVIGGLLFGAGMVLAGGCVSRLLVLSASGNLRSVVTLLVTAVTAYATLRGVLAYPRLWLEAVWDTGRSSADMFASAHFWFALAIGLVVITLLFFVLRRQPSERRMAPLFWGGLIGLLIVAGWVVTGIIGADDFEPTPLASLSFVAPVGETLQYLMIFTGDTIRFSIALVAGVIAGAFLSALLRGRLAFQGFADENSIVRYIVGGALMGFGGVTALGCTIGQGLSGVSTASPASVLALLSIVAGAYGAMRASQARGQSVRPRPERPGSPEEVSAA